MTYCAVLRKAASDRNIFVKTSLENGKFGAGKQRLHWKMVNLVLVNSGFPQTKEFLQNLSEIWARALKNVRQPCCRPKKFK